MNKNKFSAINTSNLAFLVIAAFIVLYLLPLEFRPLWIPDETRYAEIPREMLLSGDWLVPKINDLRYFEKPPMGYWLSAISIWAFGENAFAVRLSSAISAGLTGYFVFLLAVSAGFSRPVSYTACFIFFGFLAVYLGGTFSILDGPLTLFLTAGISWFYVATKTGRYAYWLLSGLAFCLAFLTKGFLAFAIPVIVLLPWILWIKRAQILFRQSWLVIATALVVALPWAIAIHMREPDFWNYFFWIEHIKRFSSGSAQHGAPFYYFIMYFPLMAFPWVSYIPAAISGLRQLNTDHDKNLIKLCILWIVIPFVFFSTSNGKLATYILPVFPPLAILLSIGLHQYLNLDRRKLVNLATIVNGVIFLLLLTALILSKTIPAIRDVYSDEYGKFALISGALLAGIVMSGLALFCKSNRNLMVLIISMFFPVLFAFHMAIPIATYKHKAPGLLLEQYKHLATEDAVIITSSLLIRAVSWYFKRQDIYLMEKGEVEYGLNYPDSQYKFLNMDSMTRLVDENIHEQPLLFICKPECDPKMESLFESEQKQKHVYGNFVLIYVPGGNPSAGPKSVD